jgi:hypothetical protein
MQPTDDPSRRAGHTVLHKRPWIYSGAPGHLRIEGAARIHADLCAVGLKDDESRDGHSGRLHQSSP